MTKPFLDGTIAPGDAVDMQTKTSMRDFLAERFSREALDELCMDLGERIKAGGTRMADSLYPLSLEIIGEGKQMKMTAQRVIEYLERRRALPFLASVLREQFPDDDTSAWQFAERR